VDYEKPLSTWIQRYTGINANCRNFEIKHACYGGTAALQMASSWLASGYSRDAKALLVMTDQSRTHIGKPWEFVLGAGASAVLLSHEPRIVELDLERTGYWTNEVSDLFRPTGATETGNSETSLVSYMEGLEGAFEHFLLRVPEARNYDGYFQRHLYHMPFGGMAWRAHKTLLRFSGPVSTREAWANFERKSLASLRHIRRMGATYSSSLFIGLVGLLEGAPALDAGERISVFSYGSGSCAEFYVAGIGEGAREEAAAIHLGAKLDARQVVSIPEYESIETQRTEWVDCRDYDVPLNSPADWYERFYEDKHLLTFRGVNDYYRQYEWS
jgi:3-hydroxy-3-methylglutaryl CoA synthase